jgi:hypothetical protein
MLSLKRGNDNMQNLIIDDGCKEFMINNDPNKVIRFNPADYGILERISNAYTAIKDASNIEEDITLKADGDPMEGIKEAAQVVSVVSNTIKEQIDYIFDSPVSSVVFGNQSPMSMVKGIPFYERFLNAVVPVIKKEVHQEQQASASRMEKYTGVIKDDRFPSQGNRSQRRRKKY